MNEIAIQNGDAAPAEERVITEQVLMVAQKGLLDAVNALGMNPLQAAVTALMNVMLVAARVDALSKIIEKGLADSAEQRNKDYSRALIDALDRRATELKEKQAASRIIVAQPHLDA